MNKVTSHQTTTPTRFALKPLLIALPLSVLAACASQQSPIDSKTGPDLTDSTSTQVSAEALDIASTNTDVTNVETTATVEPANTAETEVSQTNPTPTHKSPSHDDQLNGTPKGDAPMTVLVIESPDVLSKLANENLKPVVPTTPKIPAESMHRPGKRVFHFGFNQTDLSDEDRELIEQHAKYLKANPELEVTIHGHTDAQGNADYNLTLSKQRAAMMLSELIKHGIDKDRIKTIGWGGGYPLVSTLNFAENRRIELEYSEMHYAANR